MLSRFAIRILKFPTNHNLSKYEKTHQFCHTIWCLCLYSLPSQSNGPWWYDWECCCFSYEWLEVILFSILNLQIKPIIGFVLSLGLGKSDSNTHDNLLAEMLACWIVIARSLQLCLLVAVVVLGYKLSLLVNGRIFCMSLLSCLEETHRLVEI